MTFFIVYTLSLRDSNYFFFFLLNTETENIETHYFDSELKEKFFA